MNRQTDGVLEVVLFGPGYGESVAVNLCGRWLIVDSCVFRGRRDPAPLEYFRENGIDPATEVDWVIASHWHDDHVRGIGALFEACTQAKFGCSNALRSKEFLSLVAHARQSVEFGTSGVDELSRVLSELERRRAKGMDGHPCWILEGRRLASETVTHGQSTFNLEVLAASPSDEAVTKGLASLGSLIPATNQSALASTPKRRFYAPDVNHTAVVLSIKVGPVQLLLGSDLEVTVSTTDGWDQVHRFLGNECPANLLKVPHHGSKTGHHPGLWQELVDPSAVAIMTPFTRGRVSLPTNGDVDRILGLIGSAYISYPPSSLEVRYRDKVVHELVEDVTTSPLFATAAPGGTIRLRRDVSAAHSDWKVELTGGATHLAELSGRASRKLRLVSGGR